MILQAGRGVPAGAHFLAAALARFLTPPLVVDLVADLAVARFLAAVVVAVAFLVVFCFLDGVAFTDLFLDGAAAPRFAFLAVGGGDSSCCGG